MAETKTVWLKLDTHKKLKHLSIDREVSISDLVDSILVEYLKDNKQ